MAFRKQRSDDWQRQQTPPTAWDDLTRASFTVAKLGCGALVIGSGLLVLVLIVTALLH